MEILDNDNYLRAKLEKQVGRDIHIVSAFASSTDDLISLLRESNRVELIVGTMNYFTAPEFIQAVRDQSQGREGFWVDFRGPASIHWKLYLISPHTVIIGSANLTPKGLAMRGETSVVIHKKALYQEYRARIVALQSGKNVVAASSKTFDRRLREYTALHDRSQAGRQAGGADRPEDKTRIPTLAEWLKDESNQSVSLFLWESPVEEKLVTAAKKIVNRKRAAEGREPTAPSRKPYSELFTTNQDDDGQTPYRSGDVALCASTRGGHISFRKFHIVQRVGKSDLMIEVRREPNAMPFQITGAIKLAIKRHIGSTDYESGSQVLRRKLLQAFATA
jgi:hypothetical protein